MYRRIVVVGLDLEVEVVQAVAVVEAMVAPVEARLPRPHHVQDRMVDRLQPAVDHTAATARMVQRVPPVRRMDMEKGVLRRHKAVNHTVIQKE